MRAVWVVGAEAALVAAALGFMYALLVSAPLGAVALPLALFAAGNILGTLVGGQLADRLPNRLFTFAGAMLGSACMALPLFLYTPGLATSVGLGFGYVFVTSMARPALMASLANVPEGVRGTVLGLNVTAASFGWLGAASLGGWMMAAQGFAGFGPLAALMAGAAALFAVVPLSRRGPSPAAE